METKYIKIRDLEIPITIKSYRNSKSIKIYFKGDILTVTKPTRLSMKKLLETLKQNEEDIYIKYQKILTTAINKIYYKGEEYSITVPENINKQDFKKYIIKVFKRKTEELIASRLPYWSKITGFDYNQVKVRDATTRYGSCMPAKKNLYFSSRLIMLPENVVDAIIVHELCHMKFKNHNKEFYDLVATYIPNYKEIDKWLRANGKMIMF